MEAIGKSRGIIKRFLAFSILLSILQNGQTSSVPRGPAEALNSKNQPRLVKQGGSIGTKHYGHFEVPDYLLRLRERHNNEWSNFGQAEHENSPNLGIITSIRHHGIVEDKRSRPKWQGQQSLDFRLATISKNEKLVAGSLRLPIQRVKHQNSTIPVKVQIIGTSNTVGSKVFIEGSKESWLNIPLPPATLYSLLRRRQLLRLSVSFDRSRVQVSEADPHVLTFHRNTKRDAKINRIRRDIKAIENMEGSTSEDLINKKRNSGEKRNKRRRKNRKGKSDTSNREKRSPQYLMNKRYIESTCQRRDLMVNFNAIGWSKWVIAPMAYNAGYCYGNCPFPLSAHFNTTNHAIILHLMHNLGVAHSQINSPCCTPVTFGPQSILFFDGDDVVLQVYEDMIVESCGCR
nr:bone morphogenetic protein 2 [Hymenolepis microstoma]